MIQPPALNGPALETQRLTLRLPRAEDFDPYAALQGDPEASHFIGGPLSRPAAWRKFLQMPGAWAIQGFAMFAVIDKASGQWLARHRSGLGLSSFGVGTRLRAGSRGRRDRLVFRSSGLERSDPLDQSR